MRLKDKTAIITGAGSGLGRESARLFAQEGATVAVFDILPERAHATVDLVEKEGGKAFAVVGDVANEDDVARVVKETLEREGKVDIMFANAGKIAKGGVPGVLGGETIEIEDYDLADWNDVIAVNLTGPFLCAKHVARPMREQGGGSIVMTSSSAAFLAYPNITPYTASKAGINGMVRNLAFDLGKYGIRVNALAPTHGMSPNFLMPWGAPVVGKSYEENQPEWDPFNAPMPLKIKRPPSLRDNANVALFLASDDSAYISGSILPGADGGTQARIGIQFENDVKRDHAAWKED